MTGARNLPWMTLRIEIRTSRMSAVVVPPEASVSEEQDDAS